MIGGGGLEHQKGAYAQHCQKVQLLSNTRLLFYHDYNTDNTCLWSCFNWRICGAIIINHDNLQLHKILGCIDN